MERKPCGPPSQRHQISGPCAAGVRSSAIPASAKDARRLGRTVGDLDAAAEQRGHDGAGHRAGAGRLRPPRQGADDAGTEVEQLRPRVRLGVVEDEGPALVAVALARRPAGGVGEGGGRVERGGQQRPGGVVQRVAGRVGLGGGDEAELGDEAVVVGGQLAVDPAGEGVGGQLPLELPDARRLARRRSRRTTGRRRRRPAGRRPRRRRGCWPRSRGCGRRRGTAGATRSGAARRGCPRRGRRTLAQSSSSRRTHAQALSRTPSSMPLVQCTPDRNGFAVHQERSCRSTASAYRLVAGQPPGRGQHGEVVVARELPDRLDVAGLGLVAVVDPEREPVLRRPPAGDRVQEPVRVGDVGPRGAEQLPVPGQDPVRRVRPWPPGTQEAPSPASRAATASGSAGPRAGR